VIGIRPLFNDNLSLTLDKVRSKIKQIESPYVLGWDDCPGGQTDSQKKLQLSLVEKLPYKPWGIIPGAYYAENNSMETWIKGLSIINDVDISIPFILCSKNGINPSSFDPSTDFPNLNRKIFFWDNWMAVDSLSRLPRNLPRKRNTKKLFDATLAYGYMLNLCFPPERIIHGVAALHYLQNNI